MLERVTVVVHCDDIAAPAIMSRRSSTGSSRSGWRPSTSNWSRSAAERQISAISPSCPIPVMVRGCWCSSARTPASSVDAANSFVSWLTASRATPPTGGDRQEQAGRRQQRGPVGYPRGWLAATAFPPDGQDHWPAGKIRRCRRSAAVTTCATCKRCWAARPGRPVLRSPGPGLHPRPVQLRPAHRAGIATTARSWRRRPISSSPTGRCPASTATASSGRAPREAVRAELVEAMREFKRSGTRPGR